MIIVTQNSYKSKQPTSQLVEMFDELQQTLKALEPYVTICVFGLSLIALIIILYPLFRDMTKDILHSKAAGEVIAVCATLWAAWGLAGMAFFLIYLLIVTLVVFSSFLSGFELIRGTKSSIIALVIFSIGIVLGVGLSIFGLRMLLPAVILVRVVGLGVSFFDEFARESLKDLIGEFAYPTLLVTAAVALLLQFLTSELDLYSDLAFAVGGALAFLVRYKLAGPRERSLIPPPPDMHITVLS